MDDTLETVGKMVLARKTKIERLEQKIDNLEEVKRWKQEIEDHRIAIKQHLIEAHRRIVLNQELKDEGITWDKWVKANCGFTSRQSYKIMELTADKKSAEPGAGATAGGKRHADSAGAGFSRQGAAASEADSAADSDHELEDWLRTFASWSRSRQQIALARLNEAEAFKAAA
jgi:hypothetical protein